MNRFFRKISHDHFEKITIFIQLSQFDEFHKISTTLSMSNGILRFDIWKTKKINDFLNQSQPKTDEMDESKKKTFSSVFENCLLAFDSAETYNMLCFKKFKIRRNMTRKWR